MTSLGKSPFTDSAKMALREKLKDFLFPWRGDSEPDGSTQQEMVRRYPLVDPAKVGYAVLLGSDIILNDGSSLLQSVAVDLREMDKSLSKCGLHVCNHSLVNNQIVKFDQSLYERVLSNVEVQHDAGYGCLLFYYSGHGTHNGLLTADGDCIRYSDIIQDIGQSASKGMPRVFIFDCCRRNVANDENQVISRYLLEQMIEPGLLADTIVCFSTLDFNPSWGIKTGGSFFTRELASSLVLYHQSLPLTEIIIQASGQARGRMCTALRNSSDKIQSSIILSQPVFHSFLSATLFLTPCHKSYSTTDYKPSDELKEWLDIHLQNLESKGNSDNAVEAKDSVLIVHALDVTISDNLEQLCNLAGDLEKNNFAVCLDVWRQSDDLSRNSLLYWYSANIALSSHVVVVLSPELRKASTNTGSVLGKVWSAVCTVMCSNETECKFYPVHLRLEDTEERLPVFGGTIYNMVKSVDCNKLVKHMTGQPIDRPQPGQVTVLGKKQAAIGELPADLASLFKPKKGYRTVTHSARAPPTYHTQSQFYPATQHQPAPALQQYPATQHQPAPALQQYPATQHQPAPTLHHASQASSTQQHLYPSSPSQHQSAARSMLDKPISMASILWLSDRIIEWKFVGRYLGLEESELKRIESDNAGKMGEQCYQMLYRWQQMTPYATYSIVLEALQRAKCGPTLINEFVVHIETQEMNEEQ